MRKLILGAGATAAVLAVGGVAIGQIDHGVPTAQPRSAGPAMLLATGFTKTTIAQGSDPLENPAGVYASYGYLDDAASQPSGKPTKTEPDQNTYLATKENPGGPTAGYDYGRHFLIQGHEVGQAGKAYLTRINLDVTDPTHRITLLSDGSVPTTALDGSTYEPFSKQLLFTAERGAGGGVTSTPLTWSGTAIPKLTTLYGSMGQGGYEGIHPDGQGNVIVVEDVGGKSVTDNGTPTKVKQPNSFLFRFKPQTPGDLEHGRLQALQVSVDRTPITFHDGATDAPGMRDDALGEPIRRLHSGERLEATWITVHDTATSTAAFDANALAKKAGATPFKRPENATFVPGSDFRSLVFSETGDTNKDAGDYPGAAARGAWGALVRVDMPSIGSDRATVRTIVNGDQDHAAFDNVVFLDEHTVLSAEDRGDGLHQQLDKLDSLWAFDLRQPVDRTNAAARRLIAQGRDTEAAADAGNHEVVPAVPNQNDGDNEITGIFVSDGSTSTREVLGQRDPADLEGVRVFVTGQHGANRTYELTARRGGRGHDAEHARYGRNGR